MSFKGGMVNYYHEARAQVKKLKSMTDRNKERAERRAELLDPAAADPLQGLFISGAPSKLFRGAETHAANEAGDNLVPWNGDATNMIDRFDVRALLDFYKEPDARVLAARQKSHEELKLEESLRFESYRDLLRLMARGLTEAQGLTAVQRDSLERRAAQHAALQAATDAVYNNPKPPGAGLAATSGPGVTGVGGVPAGTGVYSAMGFSYDNSGGGGAAPLAAAAAGVSDSSSSDSDDSDSDDDEDAAGAAALLGPVSEAELAQEAEDDRVDELAEGFGLQEFTYRLHKAQEREGAEEARLRNRPRRRVYRKRARVRARRMAGQGLNPTGQPLAEHDPYKDPSALVNPWEDQQQERRRRAPSSPGRFPGRRHSPSYDAGGGWRSRGASPIPGERQYITEFVGAAAPAGGGGSSGGLGGHHQPGPGSIIDALPDRPDPAMWANMQPVKREALAVHGIKHEDLHRRLRAAADDEAPAYQPRSRSRSRSSSREQRRRRRSPTPPRHSRGRSSRSASRSRSSSRDRHRDSHRRHRSSRHSRSRSRSRSRDRRHRHSERGSRHHSRSRSRSRDRHRRGSESEHRSRRSSDGGGSSKGGSGRLMHASGVSGPASGAKASSAARAAATPAARAAAATAGGSTAKETPQERLKRLMAAQLNKAAQRDSLADAQRKIQLEKDKVARQQLERVALGAGRSWRSPSPDYGGR